jgi:hypothetical protein
LKHNHFIEVEIKEATKYLDGDREWVMGNKILASVWLSAAQFAEFITTPNKGSGTPCTLRRIQGDPLYDTPLRDRPLPPTPQPFADRFKEEGKKRARLLLEHIDRAKTMVDELADSVTKPTKANIKLLGGELTMAIQEIRSNLPYLMQSMEEQVEKRMANAVTEFESYVGTRLQRMGLEALQGQVAMLPPVKVEQDPTKLLTNG